jgi:peptide chain release factor 2
VPKEIAELQKQANAPNIWSDQKWANQLFTKLKSLKQIWEPVSKLKEDIDALMELVGGASEKEQEELVPELQKLEAQWSALEVQIFLSGPYDSGNCYLTVSGGAGGTEAQDWASMLLRMYLRYAETKDWRARLLEKTPGQEAGIKSATVHVEGAMAYGHLKCERGTHRLVRLSPFNAQNLRHTSFTLVEVLPELPETEEIAIEAKDLRIDTFRAQGAGGQHVNKTDSAVRITHLPTGITVACQNERSQLQNRVQAMKMLQAKLRLKREQDHEAEKQKLKGSTKSADFGSQIRSYVLHPYKMVKDLRTEVEVSDPERVLNGDLDMFIEAELRREAARN